MGCTSAEFFSDSYAATELQRLFLPLTPACPPCCPNQRIYQSSLWLFSQTTLDSLTLKAGFVHKEGEVTFSILYSPIKNQSLIHGTFEETHTKLNKIKANRSIVYIIYNLLSKSHVVS